MIQYHKLSCKLILPDKVHPPEFAHQEASIFTCTDWTHTFSGIISSIFHLDPQALNRPCDPFARCPMSQPAPESSAGSACWTLLDAAIRERERIISSLRQELSSLEDLTGKAIAALSPSTELGIQRSQAVLIRPPQVRPQRSSSSPQLVTKMGHLMQAPTAKPKAQTEAREPREARESRRSGYPKDFPQTPPQPRPLFRL